MSLIRNLHEDTIINLPKGDLHVHLNGAIPTHLVRELLKKYPDQIPPHFDLDENLNILEPQKNLLEYLKPWQVLNLIPKGFVAQSYS